MKVINNLPQCQAALKAQYPAISHRGGSFTTTTTHTKKREIYIFEIFKGFFIIVQLVNKKDSHFFRRIDGRFMLVT